MTSSQLRCVLWVICCLLSVVNTLLERRGIGKVQRRDNHGLYQRTTLGNLSNAFHFATDKFVSGIEVAVQQLNAYHRPLLVHTKDGRSDVLLYVRENAESFTVPISVSSYSNLQYQDDSQAVQYYPNTNLFRCNSTITFKLKDVGNLGCDLPAMGLISSLSVVVCEGTINFVVFPIANRIEPIEPGVPLCHGGYLSSSSLNWYRNHIGVAHVLLLLLEHCEAVSHIPVTATAIALPEVLLDTSNYTFGNDTLQRFTELQHGLEQTSALIQSGTFEPGDQSTRQTEIVEATSHFISAALQNNISMEMIGNFVQSVKTQLMANARDAVRDYLICLNETITSLLVQGNISSSEWQALSVVVALDPFAMPRSFIVQYYEQLLNVQYNVSRSNPERIVLLSLPRQPQSTSTITSSITALSAATLMHNLSRTFYNPSNPYTPVHQILSNAASEIICSAELHFPSCTEGQENQLPPGFETMVERAYVIIIIYTNAAAIVLTIVVLSICAEDRKMKGELKRMLRKYEGPNLFTPVNKKINSDAVNSQTIYPGYGPGNTISKLLMFMHTVLSTSL